MPDSAPLRERLGSSFASACDRKFVGLRGSARDGREDLIRHEKASSAESLEAGYATVQ